MSITILVTVIRNEACFDEEKNVLLVAKLPSPLAGACLSQQQALELWNHAKPELERRNLIDDPDCIKLQLLFLVDGVPTFQKAMSNYPAGAEGEWSFLLPSGERLWLSTSWDADIKTVTLEQ